MSITSPRPLLSITIATRNRIPWAISAIQSILDITDPRLQLVVHDNSDSHDLKKYVEENVNDSRFRYGYTNEPLSMSGNFNMAMELASGEYICSIGDDDGVNPEILEATAWAKSQDLDSLSIKQTAHYLWPGTRMKSTLFSKVVGGSLRVMPFQGKIIPINLEKELKSLMRNGGLYYLEFNLPKVYHGITRRKCMDLYKEKTGQYFGGTSPDIFSSLAISCVAKKAAVIEYPLTIPGHCVISEQTHHVENEQFRPMESAPHFNNLGDYTWCDLVPFVFVGESFWLDSGILALRNMGREDLVKELNLPKLAAHFVGGYRGISKPVMKTLFYGLEKKNISKVKGFFLFLWGLCTGPGVSFYRRAWSRIMLITGKKVCHQFVEVNDMRDCTSSLSKHLEQNGHSFSACASYKNNQNL